MTTLVATALVTLVLAILVFGMAATFMVFTVAAAFMSRIFLDMLRLLGMTRKHNRERSLILVEILRLRTWSVTPLTHGVKVAHDDLALQVKFLWV